jgi:hypothetical protein
MTIEPFPWFQWHEGRRNHFLNSQVGIVPTNVKNLPTETSFNVGLTLTPLLVERDERQLHGVTCGTTKTRNDDNQGSSSALGQSNGHSSRLKSQQTD